MKFTCFSFDNISCNIYRLYTVHLIFCNHSQSYSFFIQHTSIYIHTNKIEMEQEKRKPLTAAERKTKSRMKMKEKMTDEEKVEFKKIENQILHAMMQKKRMWKKNNLSEEEKKKSY